MSLIWVGRVPNSGLLPSCPTHMLLCPRCILAFFYICTSHVTHMSGSCPKFGSSSLFAMSATWVIHMKDMTRIYVGHDSHICGTWLPNSGLLQYSRWVCHSSAGYLWVMSHIYMIYVPHILVHIPHIWVLSRICMSHHVPHMYESCPTYIFNSCPTYIKSCPTYMSPVPHMYESSCPTYVWVMSHLYI